MRLSPSSIAAALAASLTLAVAPAGVDTLASSAISNSFSASVGSVSTSFNASSDASSPGRPLRTGQYRVVEIAAAAGREGYARVMLRPVGDAAADGADDHPLFLPLETVARSALATGHFVTARERSYGLELAKAAAAGETPQTFFLVVADERYRELQTRPVTL